MTKTVLPENAVPVLKSYSTAHITQQNAVFDDTGILICPQEPTNYALYAAKDISYIFALDKAKFRYRGWSERYILCCTCRCNQIQLI